MRQVLRQLADPLRQYWRLRGARARLRAKGDDAVIRWGVLGTGAMARDFIDGLSLVPEARLVAVGSRTAASARRLARVSAATRWHGSYEALAGDPDVDVVYIATPNHRHCEDTLLCLRGGKHVVVEKPFALDADQARRMVAEARARQRFLMEAMWMRFLPAMSALRKTLRDGTLGRARALTASFGFVGPSAPTHRLMAPSLGGGALLDVGVYGVSLAVMLFGRPLKVTSRLMPAPSGVDASGSARLEFPDGAIADLRFSITEALDNDALITTEHGSLRLPTPFWDPSMLEVTDASATTRPIEVLRGPSGYAWEAASVCHALAERRIESRRMALDESVTVMDVLDAIRQNSRP